MTLGAAFFVALKLVLSVFLAVQEPRFPEPLRLGLTVALLLLGTVAAVVTYVHARNQAGTLRS